MSGDFDFIAGTSQVWGFIKDKDNRPAFIFAIFGGLLMAAATYFDLVTYLQWVLLVALGSIFYGIQEARKEIREVKEKMDSIPYVSVYHDDEPTKTQR